MYSSSDSGHGDPISDSPVLRTDIISDSISRSDVALVWKSPITLRCMKFKKKSLLQELVVQQDLCLSNSFSFCCLSLPLLPFLSWRPEQEDLSRLWSLKDAAYLKCRWRWWRRLHWRWKAHPSPLFLLALGQSLKIHIFSPSGMQVKQ